jgi:prophage regulatory protein
MTAPHRPEALLPLAEVLRRTGVARATLYELMRDGLFPRPVQLTKRRVAWPDSEVTAFIRGKIEARDRAA